MRRGREDDPVIPRGWSTTTSATTTTTAPAGTGTAVDPAGSAGLGSGVGPGCHGLLRQRLAQVRLYVVTDAEQSPARTLEIVRAACAGGADAIQLRRKTSDALETLRLAEACRAITAQAESLFIVNDRLDVAMAAEADGVHLGQDDLPIDAARALWPGHIVGRSTHSREQVLDAVADGADYLGIGPVYVTPTKPGRPAVGLGLVASAAQCVTVPWVAIGGIDETTVDAVLRAGARAVAAVRGVCRAPDVEGAVRRLRQRIVAQHVEAAV